MKYINRKVQVPLCAVSTASSLANKTGSWKFSRPVFVDRISPCTNQCPVGEDVPGYMYLAGQERFEEAWRVIMKDNPFPAVMGRVCYHDCEERCNRAQHDEAVSVNMVERFIGDYALTHNLKIDLPGADSGRRVAIVGAGPAGLTAAYHLRIMGYKTTVFDSAELPGGMMRYGIPCYRLARDILDGEISRLYDMGIHFRMGIKVGEDISWEEIDRRFDAVFIAIGILKETDLGIAGIDKPGVFHALEFLREVNLSRRPEVGRRLAVIGGGNSALDCARVSRRLGADVTLIYRRGEAEMPAHPEEVKMAREEGIRFTFLASPKEIYGDGGIRGVRFEKMTLGETDASGRRRPVTTGEIFDFECQSVIFAIGESINIEDLPTFLRQHGNPVKTNPLGQTRVTKYFAGGDIIDIPHTVTHAIGSGKRAAMGIDRFLKGVKNVKEQGNPGAEIVEYSNLNPYYFDLRQREKTHIIPVEKRIRGFNEVICSPSRKDVIYEARRCFNCGFCTGCGNCQLFCPDRSIKKNPDGNGYVVDMDYCKGCGICVQECPRGAMKMEVME
jgi:NADPH-dependent glutamate synthase beta subunit-like oxidoreductase